MYHWRLCVLVRVYVVVKTQLRILVFLYHNIIVGLCNAALAKLFAESVTRLLMYIKLVTNTILFR